MKRYQLTHSDSSNVLEYGNKRAALKRARELAAQYPNCTIAVYDYNAANPNVPIYESKPPLTYRVMLDGRVWSNNLTSEQATQQAMLCRQQGLGMAYVEIDN